MLELSLHILDIMNNSVKAKADLITVTVDENLAANRLTVTIEDNGSGMDEDFVKSVTDPFRTTRTTRKVGMGLSLFKAAAEATGGSLTISSCVGKGTVVTTVFTHDHIDRQPLGDMAETITTVLSGNPSIDVRYRHLVNDKEFLLDTREVRQILGDVDISSPEVMMWLTDYIKEGLTDMVSA
ncbi:MAG: ATP-binding protein [Ruminococcaceae bacterium]|nr:ATP-binding protein [Oscillospiraceae bacterium]